jgi:hypothetical protein
MAFHRTFHFTTSSDLAALSAHLCAVDKQFNIIPINDELLQFSISKQTWLKFEVELYGELRRLDDDTVQVSGASHITTATYIELIIYSTMIVFACFFIQRPPIPFDVSLFVSWPIVVWITAVILGLVRILAIKHHLTSQIITALHGNVRE